MGEPIAAHLLSCGNPMMVLDLDVEKMQKLADGGAKIAKNAAEIGSFSDIVLTSLPSVGAVKEVFLNPTSGLLTTLKSGSNVVELSTNSWGITQELHKSCADKGIGFLDSPLAGQVPNHVFMVGGNKNVIEAVKPVMDQIGTIYHCGEAGAGVATKLITNYIAYTALTATLEGLVMGRKAGVDMKVLDEVTRGGFERLVRQTEGLLAGTGARDFGAPDDKSKRAFTYIIKKDVELALDLAREVDASAESGVFADALLGDALSRGWDHYSWYRVYEILEERAKLA